MKAKESVKNYPSSLRMYTNYTIREIKKVCKAFGPRASSGEAERKAQEHFKEEMATCADKVELEEFDVHPLAFMSWVVIDGIFGLLSVLFSFLKMPVVSIVMMALALLFAFTEFLMYWEFLDPLFPKKKSCNVIGTRKPTGEVKQRIIFSGHVDSAYEWTYTHLGGKVLLFAVGGYAVVGIFFVLIVSLITTIKAGAVGAETEGIYNVLKYIQLAFVPGFVLAIFFCNFKLPVEGANDNLTGSVTSIAVLKYLEDNDIKFENTEVIAMTSGCEESGLRGARAYTKRHLDELKEIPTVYFGMDTLTDYDYFAIYERDMTGTVRNDPRVCALMQKGARLTGSDLPFSSVYVGASDAAAVSKLGVPAATLAAMDPGPPRYYHTREDTADILVPKSIEKGLDICLQTLFLYDEVGLLDNYDNIPGFETEFDGK